MKANNFMAFWKRGYKWTWRYALHKVTTKARMLVTPILLMFMFYFHFVSKWYFFSKFFQRGNYNFKVLLLSRWDFCSLCIFYYFVVLTSYFFLWLSILNWAFRCVINTFSLNLYLWTKILISSWSSHPTSLFWELGNKPWVCIPLQIRNQS
jgi:hypothetical protein